MPASCLPYHLYCLEFPNGKKYIGITVNIKNRKSSHRSYAKAGSTNPIHKAIREFGYPPFRVLCVGTVEYIADLEVRLISMLQTRVPEYGYNVFIGGNLGPTMSPEVSAKISAANKGRLKGRKCQPVSPETRAKMSTARRNRPPASSETRQKMSQSQSGRTHSAETIAKIRASKLNMSDETIIKMQAAALAREAAKRLNPQKCEEIRAKISISKTNPSAETRAKISASKRGRPGPKPTVETRTKISNANRGRTFSPEHRANISKAKLGKPIKQRSLQKPKA